MRMLIFRWLLDMAVVIQKGVRVVVPETQARKLLRQRQLSIGKGVVVVGYRDDWTPEQVAMVVRAAVGKDVEDGTERAKS